MLPNGIGKKKGDIGLKTSGDGVEIERMGFSLREKDGIGVPLGWSNQTVKGQNTRWKSVYKHI
jgi:hypothetical protein